MVQRTDARAHRELVPCAVMMPRSWWLVTSLLLACARDEGSSHAGETPTPEPERAAPSEPAEPAHAGEPTTTAGDEGGSSSAGATPDAADAVVEPGDPAPPQEVELRASDGTVIHGRYYPAMPVTGTPRSLVLLFHQAGSNAGEYEPIAPRLQALGHAALAIDQRSGGRRFGRDNRTVVGLEGGSTGYSAAYPDLEAALAWARTQGAPRVLAWGSSYSAALVFRLGAEHGDELAGLLAFSPGEYLGRKGLVAGWAAEGTMPVFVSSAPGEAEEAGAIAAAAGERAVQHVPAKGVHGSSMLRPDRNPGGHEAIWAAVEAFLRRVAP